MKKKLEAELISIAHRVLKLKNRSELDQLQQETLKLYEKISVLRFVEDNFSEVKPTIGYASAEGKLEEIYETELSQGGEEKGNDDGKEVKSDNSDKSGKEEEKENNDEPKADKAEVKEAKENSESEGSADPEEDIEEYEASDKEEEITEEETDEEVEEEEGDKSDADGEKVEEPKEEAEEAEKTTATDKNSDENNEQEDEKEQEEPKIKIEVEKPQEDIKAMEESAKAVYKREQESSIEQEAQASDAEMMTIEPDKDTKIEKSDIGFEFAFERKPAPEEPKKPQREISFEDFHDYKEPEFVKKDNDAPKEAPQDDWRNWEPKKEADKPAEPVKEEKSEPAKQEVKTGQKSLNDSLGKTINLGLNDRIAFEKHLFGGSGEDLNRVLSQLNTLNSFQEAKNFVEDLVKPDYNNWKGKEEFEERFMALIEKKFD